MNGSATAGAKGVLIIKMETCGLRLTKLEINGFKSFARKTQIDFERGITAIIGPNGSGKSNIADAVRWVLGEQSARALRGAKMEDVIFNGTELRRPQAFCEVTLTFDNASGRLPVNYSEVCVTRRVYRSGESEYLINRVQCRLRDIQEMFRDTGIGKEGYSIIGQGKVEEILSNKSNDRRNAFEEAAGIMKYRTRKEEAERKLENTNKNLIRLADILAEMETQIGPLEAKSAAAKEFLRLREELKELELSIFLGQYEKVTARIRGAEAAAAQIQEECRALSAAQTSVSSELAADEERERMLSGAVSALQNRLLEMTGIVENSAGEVKVLEERICGIDRDVQRLERLAAEESERARILGEKGGGAQSAYEAATRRIADLEERLNAAQGMTAGLEGGIAEKERELESHKLNMIEAMNRLSDARSKMSRYDAIRDSLKSRLADIQAQEKSTLEEKEGLLKEFSESREKFLDLSRAHERAKASQNEASARLNETLRIKTEAESEIRALDVESRGMASRLKVLEEMKRAHEGYYASVKNILRDCERDLDLKRSIEGVVAELIRVPGEFETAVEMSLGPALQNIVTPTEEDAKRVINRLRERQYGRATLLPVSSMRPRTLTDAERGLLHASGCIGVASDLVSYEPRYQGVIENLLGRTVIVRDLDAGIALGRSARGSFRIATLQGDIINPGGSMTGGSAPKRDFSILGREREISELARRVNEARARYKEAQAREEQLKQELGAQKALLEAYAEETHQAEIRLTKQREQMDIVEKYVSRSSDQLDKLAVERGQIQDNLDDIGALLEAARSVQDNLEKGNVSTQDDVKRAQGELDELRNRLTGMQQSAADIRVELMASLKERDSAKTERRRLADEITLIEHGVAENEKEKSRLADSRAEARGALDALQESVTSARAGVDAAVEELRALEEDRDQLLGVIGERRADKERLAQELSELSERGHRQELALNRAQMELKVMQDKIWADYELTYDNIPRTEREISVAAAHLRVDELKLSMRELGEVNVNAIEDYRVLKERYDSLNTQISDLQRAGADLESLIGELTVTMEQRFKEQFKRIQANFSTVFKELFGGGHAELILSDEGDILNCDIDIVAQPPGKKLQLLSLLSGGERALTAIALLFAILRLKPAAFCILDEIESSLDEVNVANFAGYLRDYADDTQFILITHRKGSMEVCNALYGVAMEEKGVSKIVSARFQEAS